MFLRMRTKHIMKQNYDELPNGYLETINKGIKAVRRFRGGMTAGNLSREKAIARLKTEIETADAIVEPEPGFPRRPVLLTAVNVLRSISGTLRGSTVSGTSIPAASILSRRQRSVGPGGPDIFITTVISKRPNLFIGICLSFLKIRITS